jgi:hypothetical protein
MDWVETFVTAALNFVFRPDGGYYFFLLALLVLVLVVQWAQRRDEPIVDLFFFGPTLAIYSYAGILRVLLTIAAAPERTPAAVIGRTAGEIALYLILWIAFSAAIVGLHRRWKPDRQSLILRSVMLIGVANLMGGALVVASAQILARFSRV